MSKIHFQTQLVFLSCMPSPLYSSNLSMECLVLGLFMFKPPELYCKSLEVSYCYCITVNFSLSLAPHSSTLAWKIPWTEEPGGGCSPWGHSEWDTTERLHFHFSLSCIGEGNGNPLHCSCLENPRDHRA